MLTSFAIQFLFVMFLFLSCLYWSWRRPGTITDVTQEVLEHQTPRCLQLEGCECDLSSPNNTDWDWLLNEEVQEVLEKGHSMTSFKAIRTIHSHRSPPGPFSQPRKSLDLNDMWPNFRRPHNYYHWTLTMEGTRISTMILRRYTRRYARRKWVSNLSQPVNSRITGLQF